MSDPHIESHCNVACSNGCRGGIDSYICCYGEGRYYWFCECVMMRTEVYSRQLTAGSDSYG